MPEIQTQRELANHEARIEALEGLVKDISVDMKAVLEAVNKAKGGWVALAAAGAIGGVASKILSAVAGKIPL